MKKREVKLIPPSPERQGVPNERRLEVDVHGNRHLSVIPRLPAGRQGSRNPDNRFLDARFREHDKKDITFAEIGSSFLSLHSSSDRHTKVIA